MKHQKLTVDSQTLAAHWGLSDRRVRQLVDEGIAVKVPGGFDLVESDRRLIERFRRDDETKALKRRRLQQEMLVAERRLQRQEREWLTITEVQAVLTGAWESIWNSQAAVAGHIFHHLGGMAEGEKRALMFELDSMIKGELRLLQAEFEATAKRAMEKLSCELRNGIFVKTREIGMLKAEIGMTDDEAED